MSYGTRVRRDIERWISAGWIEPDKREAIFADLENRTPAWSAAGALSILGAILLAMSAISFVAANWDAMPKLLAFGCIIAALMLSLLGAGRALDNGAQVIGQALALLGALLFGAAIALTAQTFNMESFRNTALLVWAFGALAVAWSIPSRPALILATILGAWWVFAEVINPAAPQIIWSYLAVWAVMLISASRLESRVSANLLGLALLVWISNALWQSFGFDNVRADAFVLLHPLIYGALAVAAAQLRNRGWTGTGIISAWLGFATIIGSAFIQWPLGGMQDALLDPASEIEALIVPQSYLLIGAVCIIAIGGMSVLRSGSLAMRAGLAASLGAAALAVYLMIYLNQISDPGLFFAARLVIGAVYYVFCVALILIGSQDGYRATGTMGIIGFVMHTFYVYWETFEGLLTASVFFLGAGLLLFALSFAILRWRSALLPGRQHSQTGDAP